jgi:glycosyltransferase involved in cell wall biosynthesis
LLHGYRKALCVSQFVEESLAQERCWPQVQTCLHYINTDRFRPDAEVRRSLRRKFGCENNFVILAVGHLIKEKGFDVAIRALAELPANAVLWVVGTGAEIAKLQDLSCELGLMDRVMFFGQQVEVQPFMQAADCLVCPSVWAEAAGFVNLEGLSTGLPVVASRIGGIPEYVDDGQTGLLFPPGDYHALAKLLRRLQDAPAERTRLGEVGRATAVQRFSIANRIGRVLDQYRDWA